MKKLASVARGSTVPGPQADENEANVPRMLLTVEQAARLLGVGRTTMFALIRDGDLATVQIGRLRRIRPADLAAYVDQLQTVA